MLMEGFTPALIENLGVQSGMPKGPLALADELSLEMILRYENQAALHYGSKYIQHPAVAVLEKMMGDLNRLGQAKGGGFYEYHDDGSQQIWAELTKHFPTTKTSFDREEIIERFLFAQVIEAVWCLQEGIVTTIPEANLGSIFGWGFPSFKGGVLQYINDYGVKAFVEQCDRYQELHGPRFKAPSLLRKKKKAEESFV